MHKETMQAVRFSGELMEGKSLYPQTVGWEWQSEQKHFTSAPPVIQGGVCWVTADRCMCDGWRDLQPPP